MSTSECEPAPGTGAHPVRARGAVVPPQTRTIRAYRPKSNVWFVRVEQDREVPVVRIDVGVRDGRVVREDGRVLRAAPRDLHRREVEGALRVVPVTPREIEEPGPATGAAATRPVSRHAPIAHPGTRGPAEATAGTSRTREAATTVATDVRRAIDPSRTGEGGSVRGAQRPFNDARRRSTEPAPAPSRRSCPRRRAARAARSKPS